jgi:hypothetical protein
MVSMGNRWQLLLTKCLLPFRCVKYHLHGDEPEYLDAETLDVSRSHLSYTPRFTTDYGAVIGVMICFDINFFTPSDYWVFYSVDAIAFSAAWVDELPFLTGINASLREFPVFFVCSSNIIIHENMMFIYCLQPFSTIRDGRLRMGKASLPLAFILLIAGLWEPGFTTGRRASSATPSGPL